MNEIQSTILSIYKQVSAICDKHGIPFYAIGGTCIGAVRHKGFIPWDDDLDIAIPIQHFDRFWEVAEAELPEYLRIYTSENTRRYRYIFGKIHNIYTAFIEASEVEYPDAYKGIFVDIMPISSVPDDETARERFFRKIQMYSKLNYVRRFPYKGMGTAKKKIAWLLMRPLCVFTKPDHFSEKWLNMLRQVPFGNTKLTGYTWFDQIRKLTFPMKDFQDFVEVPFEDTTIKCPADYHDYLTIQFGDYMELPPMDQRTAHHTDTIDINKSYLEYRKEKEKR